LKAQTCPVCNGSGRYHDKQCHGCFGRGFVVVPEEHYFIPDRYEARYESARHAKDAGKRWTRMTLTR